MHKIFITAICVALFAQPVGAALPDISRRNEVPLVFDALLMRPTGFAAMVAGFGIWTLGVVIPPFVLAWRPTDMHKTFTTLVINPFRFTFVDPLGYHPDRSDSNRAGEIN